MDAPFPRHQRMAVRSSVPSTAIDRRREPRQRLRVNLFLQLRSSSLHALDRLESAPAILRDSIRRKRDRVVVPDQPNRASESNRTTQLRGVLCSIGDGRSSANEQRRDQLRESSRRLPARGSRRNQLDRPQSLPAPRPQDASYLPRPA